MKFNFYKIISISFLLMLINSCSNKCIVDNIEVSELLSTVAKEKSIDYCEILRTALAGDKNAIKKLSLLEFNDAVGYDHGAVIVDLIIELGETEYIKSISAISEEQKNLINTYVDVGLSYGNNSLIKEKDFKSTFPDLYIFLKK